MIFISDIIINFIDGDRVYEFFEWNKDDLYEHVKKIPLFKVDSKTLEDFTYNKVKCNTSFIKEIENKTEIFKSSGIKKIKYATLLTDTNKAVAFEFNDNGEIICRSSLLLDEELDILEIATNIDEVDISYEKKETIVNNNYTRYEQFIKNFLIQDITYSYKNKEFSKIKYLYNEIYSDSIKDIKTMYNKIIDSINNNINTNKILEIIKLCSIK